MTTTNTNDGAQKSVTTDNTGSFSFSLPPGPYLLEVRAPGFQNLLQENLHVEAGKPIGINLKLTVGAATENLTVKGSAAAAVPPPPPPPPPRVVPPPEQAKPSGPARVSSGVIQGLAISQPQPVYPEEAKAKHIQGVVVLRAHIAKDGTIKDLQVISGPPALLVSAIDAVRQWKYKPYLIDGEPTEVDTTININYTFGDSGPDMSCTYYAPPGPTGHPGTCEEDSANKGHYSCRSDDDKSQAESQPACEFKVKRQQDWLHGNLSPNSIETTPAPAGPQGAANAASPTRSAGFRFTLNKVINASDPAYPAIAKAAHVQGTVLLMASVAASGEVQDLKVMSGAPMLVNAAMEQARQMKLDEIKLGGGPYPASALIAVRFVLASPTSTGAKLGTIDPAEQQWHGVPLRKPGGAVSSPELTYKVDPEFTEEARRAKFMGAVLVNMIVDQNGVPQNVHVLRGVGMGLDENAVAAVRQYRFKPAFENGKPVPVALNVEVDFQIMNSPKDEAGDSATPPIPGKVAVPAPKSVAGVTLPVLIHQVYPEFTEEARKAKASGIVLVHFVVDEQGKPEQVRVLRGIGHGLDGKAIVAVKAYRFKPAMKDNKPVAWPLNVEVNFQVF